MRFRPGKISVVILVSVFVFLIAIFFAVSPLAKYIIEKNSVEWTGRKIKIDHLFINLWKWDVTASGLKVYENKSNKLFFSADKLYTDISILKSIKGLYQLNTFQVDGPRLVIEQNGSHFNFDDLMARFMTSDTTQKKTEKPAEPVKYSIARIEITHGTLIYRDLVLKNEIVMQQLNLGCPQLLWNLPQLNIAAGFTFKSGGNMQAKMALNLNSLAYKLNVGLQQFNLQVINPYTRDYIKTSFLGGLLSTDLLVTGNFNTPQAIALKGNVSLSDFRIDDAANVTVASWKDFRMAVDSLNVAKNMYNFGEVSLQSPYLLFEYYDKGDNFSNMMVPTETTAAAASADEVDYSNPFTIMAGYIKEISKDYVISNYTAQNVVISNGHVVYKDYTLEDKFVYDLEKLNLRSGPISSKSDSITCDMNCLANRSGILTAHLAFDPQDYKNMTINYAVEKMRISDFNPYTKFYVAHAFVEGMLSYISSNSIHNGELKSSNILNIKKIEVSRKLSDKPLYAIPLRLAIAILRDRKGNINLNIPVEGNLNDPTYKLGKVIWQIVKNLLVKAATAPFDLLAKAFGGNQEDIKYIRFDYLQHQFDSRQQKSLDLIGKALEEKPDLKAKMVQVASHDAEKELLALELAKEAYYKNKVLQSPKDSLDASDLKTIAAIANKDSLFNAWLNQQLLPENVSTLPAQLKSRKLIGEVRLGQEVDKLFALRNQQIINYLVNEKKIDASRIHISNTADEKSAEFESTPRYTVDFVVDE